MCAEPLAGQAAVLGLDHGPPEESEPSKRGRPAIGPPINVAYPEDLLARIDAAAKDQGLARAEWLRRAATAPLDSTDPA